MGAEQSGIDTLARVKNSEAFEKWLAHLSTEQTKALFTVDDLKLTFEGKQGDVIERRYTSKRVNMRIVADLPDAEMKKVIYFVTEHLPSLVKKMRTGHLGSFWVEKDIDGLSKNPMIIGLYGLVDPEKGSYKHQIPVNSGQANGHALFTVTINRWGL